MQHEAGFSGSPYDGRDSGAAAFAGFLEHNPDIIKQYRGEEKKLAQTVWGVSLIYR